MINEKRIQISKDLNIEQTKVTSVLNTYTDLCISHIKQGFTVNFLGLARLEPTEKKYEFVGTTAFYALEVSKLESISFNTVYNILKYYYRSVQNDIIKHKKARIPKLLSFTLLRSEKGWVLQSFTSKSLCEKLRVENLVSVRSHSSKLFRDYIIQKISMEGITNDE